MKRTYFYSVTVDNPDSKGGSVFEHESGIIPCPRFSIGDHEQVFRHLLKFLDYRYPDNRKKQIHSFYRV